MRRPALSRGAGKGPSSVTCPGTVDARGRPRPSREAAAGGRPRDPLGPTERTPRFSAPVGRVWREARPGHSVRRVSVAAREPRRLCARPPSRARTPSTFESSEGRHETSLVSSGSCSRLAVRGRCAPRLRTARLLPRGARCEFRGSGISPPRVWFFSLSAAAYFPRWKWRNDFLVASRFGVCDNYSFPSVSSERGKRSVHVRSSTICSDRFLSRWLDDGGTLAEAERRISRKSMARFPLT